MESVTNALRSLKLWQWVVLAVILAGAIGGVYAGYTWATGSKGGLAENQQAVPVQYGTLTNDISINGKLVFPEKETLTFGVKGTVGEVLVEEGQTVEAGQILATLDAATVNDLKKAVAQAGVNLEDAEEALAKVGSYTELEKIQAESGVNSATISLKNAEDALNDLLQPTTQDLAKAELAIANAEVSLQSAQEALEEAEVGPTSTDLEKAQSKLESAKAAVEVARKNVSRTQEEWDAKLEEAGDAVNTDQEDYQAVFTKWLGVQLSEEEGVSAPEELLSAWGVVLNTLFDEAMRFKDFAGMLGSVTFPANDPVTRWNETTIFLWLNFYFGTFVATCDAPPSDSRIVCIQQEMDDAWAELEASMENRDVLDEQAAAGILSAENSVSDAEDKVDAAEETLAELQKGPDPQQIKQKDYQFKIAEATLDEAKDALAELNNPDPLEVEAKQKQVQMAQLKLADAEEALADLLAGPDSLEAALREADVTSAQNALDSALTALEEVTLVAPISGVVNVINVEIGQAVDAKTEVMQIVDASFLELDGTVDEIDVLFVKKGAIATVTMDALAGQVLTGTVSFVSSEAQSQSGVTSYPISVRVDAPAGVQLVEGLSAVANIVINEEDGLLIPLQSVYGTYQQPLVQVVNGSKTEYREVVLGSSDDFWTVVTEGVVEGEKVVMEVTEASSSTFGTFRAGQMGGVGGIVPIGGGGFPTGGRR